MRRDVQELGWLVLIDGAIKLHQLTHEIEVWGDGWSLFFDKLVGLLHREPIVLHEVGDDQRHRARDAGHAVDEDTVA